MSYIKKDYFDRLTHNLKQLLLNTGSFQVNESSLSNTELESNTYKISCSVINHIYTVSLNSYAGEKQSLVLQLKVKMTNEVSQLKLNIVDYKPVVLNIYETPYSADSDYFNQITESIAYEIFGAIQNSV